MQLLVHQTFQQIPKRYIIYVSFKVKHLIQRCSTADLNNNILVYRVLPTMNMKRNILQTIILFW